MSNQKTKQAIYSCQIKKYIILFHSATKKEFRIYFANLFYRLQMLIYLKIFKYLNLKIFIF